MLNPTMLLKIKGAWDTFAANHPKFPAFLKAASQNAIEEGSIIEISITTKDGRKMDTNLLIKQEDMELFRNLQNVVTK